MLRLGGRSSGRLAERQRAARLRQLRPLVRRYVVQLAVALPLHYTADQLLKNDPNALWTCRVAFRSVWSCAVWCADHQTVKNVTERFDQISSDPRCSLCARRIGEAKTSAMQPAVAAEPARALQCGRPGLRCDTIARSAFR